MLVSEELRDGLHIGRQAGQAQVHLRAVGEDLGEVVADGQRLHAEAQVASDGHAVFADHGDAGTAVWGIVSDC